MPLTRQFACSKKQAAKNEIWTDPISDGDKYIDKSTYE